MEAVTGAILVGGACAAAAAGVVAAGVFLPRNALFGQVLWRGREDSGCVALTFDDGPLPEGTGPILDILERERVAATFFVIGRRAREHPELLRRIHEGGHQVGNHSLDHDRAGLFRGWAYWRTQVEGCQDVISSVLGVRPALFRAPMGFKSPPLMEAVRERGMLVAGWSRRAGDGVNTRAESIVRRVSGVGGGEVVLLHDGRDHASGRMVGATIEALPRVIAEVRARGLRLVRLDTLLGVPAYL